MCFWGATEKEGLGKLRAGSYLAWQLNILFSDGYCAWLEVHFPSQHPSGVVFSPNFTDGGI